MGEWIDLTRPVHAGMDVFSDGHYRDAPTRISPWSTVAGQGFATQQVTLGTQCGTHIDAPAHFVDGAPTLDRLPAAAGLGQFTLIPSAGLSGGLARAGDGGRIPVLDARARPRVPASVLTGLDVLDCRRTPLVVLLGELLVDGPDPYAFHRGLARRGGHLVEDLAAARFPAGVRAGRIVIAWLNLQQTSGSPCRVLVRDPRGTDVPDERKT